MSNRLVKREEASELVLTVMIWGVLGVLTTRAFLEIMNYPKIVFGQWHIAHVLFGGVFMLAAMIMVLAFEGSRVRKNGAVMFGIGWGLFIDEVGKYLTLSNDYLFRPAIIFIYISFVGLFLFYRYLERMKKRGAKETFYAVLNNLGEVAENDLDITEKRRLEDKLHHIYKTSNNFNLKILSSGIRRALKQVRVVKNDESPGVRAEIKNFFKLSYDKFFKRKMVMYGLWGYSIYYAMDKILDIFRITTSRQKMMMIEKFYEDYNFFGKSDIYMIVFKMIFDLIAAILFLLGVRYFWSKKRTKGIRYFKYGLYVSILFVSIFRFYFEQFGAIFEVVIGILLLEILNMYSKEAVK